MFALLLTATVGRASAQVVIKGAPAVATIKTPTVQCEECKKRIESYLIREQGVTKVVVDYKKKITKVYG